MPLNSDDASETPTPPIARYGQLEVDTFCTHCNYNLHGQPVSIDERLGFPICRCPECGRFHPAGVGVSASSLWVRRWASLLLCCWVLAVIAMMIASFCAMGGLSAASVEVYTRMDQIMTIGKPTMMSPGVPAVAMAPSMQYAFTLQPWTGSKDDYGPPLSAIVTLSSFSLLAGLLVGVLSVTLFWHWKKIRYLWLILLPLIPLGFLFLIYSQNDQYRLIRNQCFERISIETSIQMLGILIGIAAGRMVSRTIIRMIIPPKPRQALAFLWMVDGKLP